MLMGQALQILGLVGTLAAAIGYVPQIVHLVRERCAAGISVWAWQIWLLSSVLIFSHAFEVFDIVFMAQQTVNSVAMIVIIFFATRYRGMTCATHGFAGHHVIQATTEEG
jgi:hypothetical protein